MRRFLNRLRHRAIVCLTLGAIVVIGVVLALVLLRQENAERSVAMFKQRGTSASEKLGLLRRLARSRSPEARKFVIQLIRDPHSIFPGATLRGPSENPLLTYYQGKAIEWVNRSEVREDLVAVLIDSLNKKNQGKYSAFCWWWAAEYVTGTREVRQLAREALKDITGMDFGYDKEAWIKAVEAKYSWNMRDSAPVVPAENPIQR